MRHLFRAESTEDSATRVPNPYASLRGGTGQGTKRGPPPQRGCQGSADPIPRFAGHARQSTRVRLIGRPICMKVIGGNALTVGSAWRCIDLHAEEQIGRMTARLPNQLRASNSNCQSTNSSLNTLRCLAGRFSAPETWPGRSVRMTMRALSRSTGRTGPAWGEGVLRGASGLPASTS